MIGKPEARIHQNSFEKTNSLQFHFLEKIFHFFIQLGIILFSGGSLLVCLLPGYEILREFSENDFVRENEYQYFIFIGFALWLATFYSCLFVWEVIVIRLIYLGQSMEGTYSMTGPHIYQFLLNYIISKLFDMVSFPCSGTPFVVWMFRCMGTKIGGGTFLFRARATEFGLIEIGEDCLLHGAIFEGHSFRNKKLRRKLVKLENKCHMQFGSSLHCGTMMGNESTLFAGSEPFIGTQLQERGYYFGVPAEIYGVKKEEEIQEARLSMKIQDP